MLIIGRYSILSPITLIVVSCNSNCRLYPKEQDNFENAYIFSAKSVFSFSESCLEGGFNNCLVCSVTDLVDRIDSQTTFPMSAIYANGVTVSPVKVAAAADDITPTTSLTISDLNSLLFCITVRPSSSS